MVFFFLFDSDGVPLFGYRRRSYLVLCGILGALCWGSLALFIDSKYAAMTAILLSSLSVAFSDVVCSHSMCISFPVLRFSSGVRVETGQ